MTTPPPEITDEHIALLADLHAVIAQAMARTPYVLGQPVDDYAAIITADVAAYMGRQVAGVAAELDAARAERDAFADRVDTLTAVAKGNKRHVQEMYTDLLKAQADAEQARAASTANAGTCRELVEQVRNHAAESDRLRQQLASARNAALTEGAELISVEAEAKYQRDFSDNRIFEFTGAKRAADLLLAARTQPAT
ncbi:hypothetical protein OG689_10605 [Kitasatospora sp. NBC_00240]|uniref:hypothetical protein n=1 Tax=Kitasatospora sp. NBC_00240 TaxID=2903567 RepID=UPI0022581AC8|nr:hypothetical protein [Kitasatospora sp. NBC_00240]MCX5209733.1 hypothetical protein [Kitasatospora sp. NBC_00240]